MDIYAQKNSKVVRFAVDEGKTWFPIIDISRFCRKGSGLNRSANAWFKNNIEKGSIKKLKIKGEKGSKGGDLLCVDAENIRIVGMYEAHLASGLDFRVKWADLPDTPVFDSDVKRELSWKNIYNFSISKHQLTTGINAKDLSKMRNVFSTLANKTGDEEINKRICYHEAVSLIKCGE